MGFISSKLLKRKDQLSVTVRFESCASICVRKVVVEMLQNEVKRFREHR